MPSDPRRVLVDLFPQFLMRRRRGWSGINALLADAGIERPAFFLLRDLVQELPLGSRMTLAELQENLYNPYNTIFGFVTLLPHLVEAGYLAQQDEHYSVTTQGRALIERAEREIQVYLATLTPVPQPDLQRLAELLSDIAERMWTAPEPAAKLHQARARWFSLADDSAPLVRLDAAIYALWTARDDAHNAAWRAAGFTGPHLDLLSRLWSGEATTLRELMERVQHAQRSEDVQQGIEQLIAKGYVVRDAERLRLTEHGQATRDALEAETDRIFFAPWPPLSSPDIAWLHDALKQVIAALP